MFTKLFNALVISAVFLSSSAIAATDLLSLAKQQESYLLEIRNHLHENPETGWQEDKSLAYIKEQLLSFKPQTQNDRYLTIYEEFEGGLVADISIPGAHRTVLFRADIDALPILEEASHQPISKVPGKMHACGHDAHSAMLLTAAKLILTDASLDPKHHIRLVWQRSEENPGLDRVRHSGGYTLVKENVLHEIEEVYAIHVWSKLPAGTVYSRQGPIFGNTAVLNVDIEASGGHTSSPHQGVNALRVGHSIVESLKDLPVRTLGPSAASLEPTVFKAGEASNVMPSSAKLAYSIRTFLKPEDQKAYLKTIEKTTKSLSEQFDAKITVDAFEGYPATINDKAVFEKQVATLSAHGLKVEEMEPVLAGEDFSYYLQQKPGVFWILGAQQPSSGPHHSPTFNPDSSAFYKGVALWLALAVD